MRRTTVFSWRLYRRSEQRAARPVSQSTKTRLRRAVLYLDPDILENRKPRESERKPAIYRQRQRRKRNSCKMKTNFIAFFRRDPPSGQLRIHPPKDGRMGTTLRTALKRACQASDCAAFIRTAGTRQHTGPRTPTLAERLIEWGCRSTEGTDLYWTGLVP